MSALLTGFLSAAYLANPEQFHPFFKLKYLEHLGTLLCHGVGGILALGLGPFLITSKPLDWGGGAPTNQARGRFHTHLGYLYFTAVMMAGISGIDLASIAFGGWVSQAGFLLLAVFWILTALLAVKAAKSQEFLKHRQWMSRNYALTFSAVVLRVILNSSDLAGIDFEVIYPWAAWLSWVPNLILTEVLLRSQWKA